MSLKSCKLGLSKVVKLKTILFYLIQSEDMFCKVSVLQHTYFKGQDSLEGDGVEMIPSQDIL